MHAVRYMSHNWLIKQTLNRFVEQRLSGLSGIVLDLGCGTRPFEPDIRRYATDYIGLDWSNSLHNLRADIIANLNETLPILDESVDQVVCFEVMEHLAKPTVMLTEAARVLRKDGEITLSVPFQWWVHEAPWDYYRYTQYGLRHLLEQAGFSGITICPTTGFWTMWVLKLNYQLKRLIRGPRLCRIAARMVLIPFWWLNQHAARLLDSWWPEDKETAGYFVTAQKA